jgi:Leucine-rich repeat (LRR) protein
LRYFLSTLILFLSCTTLPEDVPGCTNSSACNFNPDANEDDGSCASVLDMCGICDNDSSNDCVQDCGGIWGGSTLQSTCENCISSAFDCKGNCCVDNFIYDLEQLVQTDAACFYMDNCNVCDSDPENDCVQDCAGIWGGYHEEDENGFTLINFGNQVYERSCEDLFALQNIIVANDFSIIPSAQNDTEFHAWDLNENGLVDPWEFGVQNWSEEGRLIYLKVNIPIILTDSIGALTELTELILEASGLAAIPETIGNLQKLKIFNLTSNSISILPERIIELTNLEELLIPNNNILYFPDNIGNLIKLTKLEAQNNQLSLIPESIINFESLNYLFLENNKIGLLPNNFGNLSNLLELKITDNQLEEFPENFGSLSNLKLLLANNNNIEFLPENFGNLTKLKILRLNDNKLISIPASIGNLVKLEELWLQNNQIISLPKEIGNLTNLAKLFINDNLLEFVPETIVNLENLIWLNMDNNSLSELPESFCNIYSELDIFSISNNFICDSYSIPTCLGDYLGEQICSYCLPNEFLIEGYCADTSDYNILQNFLDMNPESQSLPFNTGIPMEAREVVNTDWWENGRLVEITFQHKQLTSEIPEEFGLLDKLEILRLTDNHLIGEIPDGITNLTNLKTLKLSSNFLEGPIPENIGELTRLDSIMLSDNLLTGSIPSSIGSMTNIKYLYFDGNLLTGSIPETIGDLGKIVNLYIDNNKLTGEIPSSIGKLLSLGRLYLLNNCLTGPIPVEMCNIYNYNPDFRSMLHNNQFVQPYPDCIKDTHLGNQLTDCPY